MSLQCLPSGFGSVRLTVWEMSFEEFQDGRRGGHHGYWNGMIFSNSEFTCFPSVSHQVLAQSDMGWEEMPFKEFQDGHLGYQNRTILAILNLYVTPMLPITLQLNQTYALGGGVVSRNSTWPTWRPSWISERNDLAILNLHVTPILPIKFQLNLTNGLGEDVV